MTEPPLGDPDLVVSPDPNADPDSLDVSVVIPCLNEEPTIEACVLEALSAIRAAMVRGEVIVVDNGSTDRSAELAAAAGARVVEEDRPGYGRAYLAGLREAKGTAIFLGDGDGTYDFGELPRFLALFDEGADLVMGSRLKGEIEPGAMPWHHRWIGNPALTGLLNVIYRSGMTDAHCGLRMIRRSTLPKLDLCAAGMEFASEVVIKAKQAGLRCAEIPTAYRRRPPGSRSKLKAVEDGLRHVGFILSFAPAAIFWLPATVLVVGGLGLLIAPGHRAALDVGGIVLFAIGALWGQVGYWLAIHKRVLLQSAAAGALGWPWALSTWGMAVSVLLTVAALGTAWVAADMPAGTPLTSAGGRVALVSFVLAVLLLGAGLAMIRLDSLANQRGLSSSNGSKPKPSPWSRPPVIWFRRHPLFISAFVVAAGLRFATLWAYRPALIFHGDSFGYLDNATRLVPNNLRPIVYPVFLRLLLPLHNLMVVTGVQHLMGLGVGVMVYVLLRRLGVGHVLASLGALPVLFDAYQLNIEQYILTEPLFELLVVGAVVLVVWPKRPPLAACVGAGVLLAAATLTRTIGLVLIVPVLAYLLVRRVGALRATSLAVAFVVPMLAYGVWFHQNYGVYGVTAFDGYWLYGRVGQFADCSGVTLPTYERRLCEQIPPSDRPGPNAYVWGGKSPLRGLRTPRGVSHNAALKDFAVRIIEHQPWQYATTVGAELLHYFEPGRNVGPRDYPVRTWQFKPFRIRFDAAAQIYVIDGRFPVVDRPIASKLWTYQRFAYTTGPLLGLALLLGLAGLVRPARRAARRLRAESLLFVSSGFLLLLVTEMTAMFDYRYLLPSLPFFGAAGALGAAMVLQRIRRLPADLPAPRARLRLDEASSPEVLSVP